MYTSRKNEYMDGGEGQKGRARERKTKGKRKNSIIVGLA